MGSMCVGSSFGGGCDGGKRRRQLEVEKPIR